MLPRLAAYGLIAAFIFVERRLRRGHAASTLEALPSDRGTTRVIGATYGYALSAGLLAPVLSKRGIGRLPTGPLQAFGIGVMVAGLLLRIWAALTLGRFYTRTLRVSSDQTVVRTGPYRFLRHPGYARGSGTVARLRSGERQCNRRLQCRASDGAHLRASHRRGGGHARSRAWRTISAVSARVMARAAVGLLT